MSRIEPEPVAQEVDLYVDSELRDAQKYTNRQPLDSSGVWSLHALAAQIYAMGWEDGERATAEKERRAHARRPPTQPARAAGTTTEETDQ